MLDHLPKATKKQYMQAYKSAYKQINKHPGPAHSARHLKSSIMFFPFCSLLPPFCLHMPPICLSYASHMPPICLPWPPSASKLSPSVPEDAPRWQLEAQDAPKWLQDGQLSLTWCQLEPKMLQLGALGPLKINKNLRKTEVFCICALLH